MKAVEYTFTFEVEYSIKDIEKQLNVSTEALENMSSMELRDLFINGANDLDSGEITVDEDYSLEPTLNYDKESNTSELYARFNASYNVEVEGENVKERDIRAQDAFDNVDFGDYEFVEGSIQKSEKYFDELPKITVEEVIEYLEGKGYEILEDNKELAELCDTIASNCNSYFEDYSMEIIENPLNVPTKDEMLEEVVKENAEALKELIVSSYEEPNL